MLVNKQNVNIGKAVYEGDIKTGAEGSIIVPDVKPDILKVLQVDAETFLTEKQVDNGKIVLKGKVAVNVLYVPESDENCIGCIKGCFEFCETLKRTEFTDDMKLIAYCDAEKIAYRLINSRKIGIEAQILISVQVLSGNECSFVTDVEDECAEIRKENIYLPADCVYKEFSFKIEESLDFPQGKCQADEILKTNLMIMEKEYKALEEKMVVKGRVCASVLYKDENGRCEHLDFEIPFTEVFDVEGMGEFSECDVGYQILGTDFSLSAALSGDGKCILMSADALVCVRCENRQEISAVSDCYLTNSECRNIFEEIETEEVVDRPMFSAVMKELMQRDENSPEIASVYTAVAKPCITSSQPQNGRIAVSGKTLVYILYTTDNPQMPVHSLSEEIPFSYMIDCENVSRDCDVLLKVECEHISYTISSSNAVEIRCGLGISGKIVKKSKVCVIKDIEFSELPERESGMIIYFVKDGDNLWDIAKYYHVKCESILACNGLLEDAVLQKGEKLIIPVA